MNKGKLVQLTDEVLTDIDVDMQSVLRKQLEMQLLERLSWKFNKARHHLADTKEKKHKLFEKAYKSVKPIIDDSIDKLLGETK
tara:strand:- start:596 stop:844 length:249 start_codon:yes stop_codon:yes gene_type:complete